MAALLLVGSLSGAAGAQGSALQDLVNPGLAPTTTGASQGTPAEPQRARPALPYDEALAQWRAGRATDALRTIETALAATPRDPRLRFLRGVILAEQDQGEAAIAVFQSLTEDFPELPEPYNNLAVLYAGRGDWNAARDALERSLRAVPDYALAHENLGDIYLQLAARAYADASRLDPRNTPARNKLTLAREWIARVQRATPSTPSSNPRPGAPSQVSPK